MLSVEEAKEKLCPYMPERLCAVGGCAMWRFSQKYDSDFQRRAEEEYAKSGKRIQPSQGYCGLAGVPEF